MDTVRDEDNFLDYDDHIDHDRFQRDQDRETLRKRRKKNPGMKKTKDV